MNENVCTLVIRKYYFNQILSGEKTLEYRDYKEYYQKRFSCKPRVLRLHYQRGIMLEADIKFIKRIKKPKALELNEWFKSKFVFIIKLSNPRLI